MVEESRSGISDVYISVDIEAAGPVPSLYSMLSLGACRVDAPEKHFYVEIKPINNAYVPEALKVSGFSLESLSHSAEDPKTAMDRFRDWIISVVESGKPVMVGFNAGFDWSFVNWYFHKYVGDNPFGFGAVDIKSYFMGLSNSPWSASSSSRLPEQFQPVHQQTHNALDDALAQAEIFEKLLAFNHK